MVRNWNHLHPVAFAEDGRSILVDTIPPEVIERISELADEDAREAVRKALRWVLEAIGGDGVRIPKKSRRSVVRLVVQMCLLRSHIDSQGRVR